MSVYDVVKANTHYKLVYAGGHQLDVGESIGGIVKMNAVPPIDSSCGWLVTGVESNVNRNWSYTNYHLSRFFEQVACERHFEVQKKNR